MPISCPHCAAQMPETAVYCPGCGMGIQSEVRAQGKVGGIAENIVGAVAYITFLPSIIFLVLDPYRKNRFVRFHSIQCLLFWGAAIAIAVGLKIATLVLFIIPVLGPLLVLLISMVVGLAMAVTWLVLVVKAFQGEMFKLPWLGDVAEQRSNGI